ncbi:MAG: protoglobin domain-containing protein [Gallionellaceae bacterium]
MSPSGEAVAALARSIGIDAQEITRRKAFLEFDETDVSLLTELHARLQDVSQHFVNDFYTHLIKFEETRRFIPDAPSIECLKHTQAACFDSLITCRALQKSLVWMPDLVASERSELGSAT